MGENATGSWISALALSLLRRREVNLNFIYFAGSSDDVVGHPHKLASPWAMEKPRGYHPRKRPSQVIIDRFREIVEEMNPDIIHVWGTEGFLAHIALRGSGNRPVLVSVQGIMSIYRKYVFGTRNMLSIMRWITPHDLLSASGLLASSRSFRRIAHAERSVMHDVRYVECATPYMEAWVKAVNNDAVVFSCPSVLRDAFYKKKWTPNNAIQWTIFSADAVTTYKGFDILLNAAALLMKEYLQIQIRVAGPIPRRSFLRASGYERYIYALVKRFGLDGRVVFLGPLNQFGMAEEMSKAHCVSINSLIETQSLVMLEAMAVGAPVIAPYAGGMPDLFTNMRNAVGYSVGDPISLSHGIRRIFRDKGLAKTLSEQARSNAFTEHDPQAVAARMTDIYRQIHGESAASP
jgi:glycosyltransferase involved in cell wall biosynthesis